MTNRKDRWLFVASLALVTASVVFRMLAFPRTNGDMQHYNLIWYRTILSQGVANALGTAFTNYSPPYSYLLAFASLFKGILGPLATLKLIPTLFDVFGAGLVYKIIRLKFPAGAMPVFAAALYFAVPTVIMNSSLWGQVDSIYTFFLLASVYFLLTDREHPAWISLGMSFAVKAQAVFLAPMFLILLLQKRLSWKGILWVPAVYALTALPTILLGRSALDVFTVYLSQSETFNTLSNNAPNFYSFLPQAWYSSGLPIGLILAAVIIVTWAYNASRDASIAVTRERIILYALLSTALVPFLLPKMHDRYFYPADVLSVVAVFFYPQLWFVPLLTQSASAMSYLVFLFKGSQSFVLAAALVMALALAALLKEQQREAKPGAHIAVKLATVLLTLSIPLIIFGAGLRTALTPLFLRAEYQFTQITVEHKQEQYRLDGLALEYVTAGRPDRFLQRLPVNPVERQLLSGLRFTVQNALGVWRVSLLMLFTASLLLWAHGSLSQWIKAALNGGKIAMGSAPFAGLLFYVGASNFYSLSTGSVLQVFSQAYWLAAAVWVFITCLVAGLAVTTLRFLNKE